MACMRTQGPGASLEFLGDAGHMLEPIRHRKRKAISQRPDRYLDDPLSWPSWVPDWSLEVGPAFHRIESLLQMGNSACKRVRGVRVLFIDDVARDWNAMRTNHTFASIDAHPDTDPPRHEIFDLSSHHFNDAKEPDWDDDVDVAWRRKAKVSNFWAHFDYLTLATTP